MLISDWSSDVCSSDLGEGRSCEASLVPDHADTAADLWRIEKCPRQIHRILRRDDLLRAVQPGSRATQRQSSWAGVESVRPRQIKTLDPLPRHVRELHARSEEHTSELQSLMRISYAVFCLKKKT